jgi:predicted naringenin-chalcone synthase
VLSELCKQLTDEDQGKKVLSFAFGPGLTLESMVLEIQNH